MRNSVRLILQITNSSQLCFIQSRSFSYRMPTKSIPDRWLDYKPLGDSIEGTRFLPCKVPLKKILHESNSLPKEQEFTPTSLFEILDKKKLNIGLLIDLTFTRRYYNSEEITSNGVEYMKVFVAGKQVPTPDVVRRFTSAVKKFEEENADNDLLIGVHCTHGVNRTGYLICRYMIDHLKFKPEDALKAYEKARGYPVERKNYVEDLHTRPRPDDEPEETNAVQDSYPDRRQNNYGRRGDDWHREYSTDTRHSDRYQPYYNRHRDNRTQGYDEYYGGGYDNYYQPSGYEDRGYYQSGWNDGRGYNDYSDQQYNRQDRNRERQYRDRSPYDDRSANRVGQSSSDNYYSDRRRRGSTPMKGRQGR